MKFTVALLLTGFLSFAWALFFPWWIIAVVAFLVAAVVDQKPLLAFLSAFIALFLLWGGQSFLIDQKNQHLLSSKIANILPLGGSYIAVIVVTAFIAALIGGVAALSGSYLRTPAKTKRTASPVING